MIRLTLLGLMQLKFDAIAETTDDHARRLIIHLTTLQQQKDNTSPADFHNVHCCCNDGQSRR
jgi:hypothetical protein